MTIEHLFAFDITCLVSNGIMAEARALLGTIWARDQAEATRFAEQQAVNYFGSLPFRLGMIEVPDAVRQATESSTDDGAVVAINGRPPGGKPS